MNDFKLQYIVLSTLSRWMQDGFSYCHSNLIFWEQLLDLSARQYLSLRWTWNISNPHRRSSIIVALRTPSLEVPKSRERPLTCTVTNLFMLQVKNVKTVIVDD